MKEIKHVSLIKHKILSWNSCWEVLVLLCCCCCCVASWINFFASLNVIFYIGRWLVLFCPFNLFNNILQVDVGDLKPVLLLINLLTILKQVALVNAGKSKRVGSILYKVMDVHGLIFKGEKNGCNSKILSKNFSIKMYCKKKGKC